MAKRYLKAGEVIPKGTWCNGGSGPDFLSIAVGATMLSCDVREYYVLTGEVTDIMAQIKSHLTSAQQLMQELETRLSTMDTVPQPTNTPPNAIGWP